VEAERVIKPTAYERILVGQLFLGVKEEIRQRDVERLLAEYRDELLTRLVSGSLDYETRVQLEELMESVKK
jgi:hypothetical protein